VLIAFGLYLIVLKILLEKGFGKGKEKERACLLSAGPERYKTLDLL